MTSSVSLLSQSQHWVSRQSSHTIVRKVSVSSHAYTLHRHSFKCQSNYRPDLNSSVFSLERDRIWRRMKSDAQLRYNIGILQVSDIICTTPITHDWWPKPLFGKSTGFFSSWPYVLASTIRFTVDCAQNFTSKYTRLNLPWYFCHVTKIFNNHLDLECNRILYTKIAFSTFVLSLRFYTIIPNTVLFVTRNLRFTRYRPTVWVKKVAHLKLFAIFSLRPSIFLRNFANLMPVYIRTRSPVLVDLS